MLNKLIDLIKENYELKEVDVKEFKSLKVSGMKFNIEAYDSILGRISIMKASGFFGLMKMDTLMITPLNKDLPLLSYDRVNAFGNDTLIIELYDTVVNDVNLKCLSDVKEKYSYLDNHDLGSHWYDSIKLDCSISKKSKKDSLKYDELTLEFFKKYLNLNYDVLDLNIKKQKSLNYIDGLLNNGGPSTSIFIKKFGKENTTKLFKEILFGVC